ncbi:AMP-binding protein [Nocardia puris]|uniref:Acyl-CoA synthetase (AMP-forming)/AMP-acid ligase II n=1 Tax=Nocardia puris TaxID=208602 RepID=A0A366DUW3_9NOCA|nr:AMP-binding protein [Nocardia puris]RBO93891.1 acyl-CoA synthetase (AMP-forming)/AMP-acid ligase II [Nocardia puris]
MVTDVIDVTAEFPIPRKAVWDLLREPQTYPRVFPGIGACEPMESVGGHQVLRLRIGTAESGVRTQVVQVRVGRWYESLELICPALGSFASVRLRGDEERTRIAVTFFAPGRVHPAVPALSNGDVTAWAERGLRRIADLVRGATTSVVVNGENSPLRRRAQVVRQIVSTGVVRAHRPDVGFKALRRLSEWGFNLAGGYAAAAAFAPDRPGLIDANGVRTFGELHERTTAIAGALEMLGLSAGDAVGLLARNHRGMVETMVAAGKLGVDVALLNTGLPARRIEEVVQRDKLAALFVDGEFDHLIQYLHDDLPRYATDAASLGRPTLDDLAEMGHTDFRKPTHPGKLIVLTSGTSGTPKGARRPHAKGFSTIAALLSRIPLGMDETMLIPAPLFHTWGLAALQLSTALRSTVVLPDQFDAEDCLRLIAEHRVSTFIAVPIMVHRILELPSAVRARYDTSCLRIVASCGAPLAASTVLDFLDAFGDVLYNVYGSTEVSWGSIADPADLRAAPTTAGRPPLGTRVAILGPDHRPLPVGATGHIFVGNHMLFDGYVNASPPDEADGMLDTGDLGYLDAAGRLFIAGRDDEMIISGGENVFPRPVEEALAYLPQVREVAVVGVPDREYGQRLAAFVVKREGAGLDSDMVRTYIRNRLSRFSVPRDVTFLNALPRGETGKILKRLLTGTDGATQHPIIGTIAPGPS